jgi:hypothetical protein
MTIASRGHGLLSSSAAERTAGGIYVFRRLYGDWFVGFGLTFSS